MRMCPKLHNNNNVLRRTNTIRLMLLSETFLLLPVLVVLLLLLLLQNTPVPHYISSCGISFPGASALCLYMPSLHLSHYCMHGRLA
jgi:hypothetical protein